jgi:hypothetical protein
VIAFKSVSVPEVLDDGQRALLCPVNLEPTAPSAASASSIALGYARISKSDLEPDGGGYVLITMRYLCGPSCRQGRLTDSLER